jgi:hypothetical protein
MSKEPAKADPVIQGYRDDICAKKRHIASLSGDHPAVSFRNDPNILTPNNNATEIKRLEAEIAELEGLVQSRVARPQGQKRPPN